MARNLGKYLFSREPVLNVKVSDISILELVLQLCGSKKKIENCLIKISL